MSKKKKVSPLERAWAAGVFESKVTLSDKNNVLVFDTKWEEIVHRFKEATGVGNCLTIKGPRLGALGQYRFQTTSLDESRDLILFVLPMLGPTRAAQTTRVLRRIESSMEWRKKNPEKAASLVTDPA